MESHDSSSGGLTSARRNNFFYGKMMGVLQFRMEQQYERHLRRIVESLEDDKLCRRQWLESFYELRKREPPPGYNHRPPFHATHAINTIFNG